MDIVLGDIVTLRPRRSPSSGRVCIYKVLSTGGSLCKLLNVKTLNKVGCQWSWDLYKVGILEVAHYKVGGKLKWVSNSVGEGFARVDGYSLVKA
jgi:hypothetical protein